MSGSRGLSKRRGSLPDEHNNPPKLVELVPYVTILSMNMLFPLWLNWLSGVLFHTSMLWKLSKLMLAFAIGGVKASDSEDSQRLKPFLPGERAELIFKAIRGMSIRREKKIECLVMDRPGDIAGDDTEIRTVLTAPLSDVTMTDEQAADVLRKIGSTAANPPPPPPKANDNHRSGCSAGGIDTRSTPVKTYPGRYGDGHGDGFGGGDFGSSKLYYVPSQGLSTYPAQPSNNIGK